VTVAVVLVVAIVALGIVALGLGAVALTPAEVVGGLLGTDPGSRFIVVGLRLPRVVLGLLVGAALGLAGALLQSVVRNPLASPDIVGLTGGASAAAVLAIGAGASWGTRCPGRA
jgi:iron complex transport system permease protein